MGSISESMDQIIYVGVGVFILVLLLSLTFQGYAQSNNQIIQGSLTCSGAANTVTCSTNPSNGFFGNVVNYGYAANYTKYAGPLPNTYGGALQLAVFALVFIAVILAVVGALRGDSRAGVSGGFLSR